MSNNFFKKYIFNYLALANALIKGDSFFLAVSLYSIYDSLIQYLIQALIAHLLSYKPCHNNQSGGYRA